MPKNSSLPLPRGIASAAMLALLLPAAGGGCRAAAGEARETPFVPAPRANVEHLQIEAIDKIDVLFVVDSSGSMREEQQALVEQFPALARALATGDIDADGRADFPPPDDVQFGVVSPDMGLPGNDFIPGCQGLGDDGVLGASSPPAASCDRELPAFVRYRAEEDEPDRAAADFACLANLGTDGCGFEQQLEAALKALWPAADDRLSFHGVSEATRGHGDGANAGFSRADGGEVPSLLVIVVITDEDDCSAADLSVFRTDIELDPSDPLYSQDLNVRCFYNQDTLLYPIERYRTAFAELRPGADQLVVFAAIAGVPPDRVGAEALASLDYDDGPSRERFYERLLDDTRMQQRLDDSLPPEAGQNLLPACETEAARAYPARRLTRLAQQFGENGIVQSICSPDRSGVLRFVLQRVANRMRNPMP